MGDVHCEPLGLSSVRLMLNGKLISSFTAGAPLCVDVVRPVELWTTFCR